MNRLTRRSFLAMPLVAPAAAVSAFTRNSTYRCGYDHVMGTSLDLALCTPVAGEAQRAESAALDEIDRLSAILSTYDPHSEISRSLRGEFTGGRSRELDDVLRLYERWERVTNGALSSSPAGTTNIDALGKAYIVERAAAAMRRAAPGRDGLINAGGDIVAWGRAIEVPVADPFAPFENAPALTGLILTDAAVATSGTYARGGHIIDPRTGRPATSIASATVVATDCITANALATALCVLGSRAGLALVEKLPDAEALIVDAGGITYRSSGFRRFERQRATIAAPQTNWPSGYEVSVNVPLRALANARAKRPYVAVWAETPAGAVARILAVWGDKPKYLAELGAFWRRVGTDDRLLRSVTRATRGPGIYKLVWNGLDDAGKAVPPGSYNIVVESDQEHGSYGKQSGTIVCGTSPASIELKGTSNFDPVKINYGPRTTA